jgi:hypothetical protein
VCEHCFSQKANVEGLFVLMKPSKNFFLQNEQTLFLSICGSLEGGGENCHGPRPQMLEKVLTRHEPVPGDTTTRLNVPSRSEWVHQGAEVG